MEDEKEEEQTLSQLTGKLSENSEDSYSVSEEEHDKIVGELSVISTSTEFFEEEKKREKDRKEQEKAENIREALMVGEEVSTRDQNWLVRYDEKIKALENTDDIDAVKDESDVAPVEITDTSIDSDLDFNLKETSFSEDEALDTEDELETDVDDEILDLSFSESTSQSSESEDDISVDDEIEPLKDI